MLEAKTTRRERRDKETAIKALQKEETTRLNAEIPASLHKRIKVFAVSREQSITDVIKVALDEYLLKYSNEEVSKYSS